MNTLKITGLFHPTLAFFVLMPGFLISYPIKSLAQSIPSGSENLTADAQFVRASNLLLGGLLDQSVAAFSAAEVEYSKLKNDQQLVACYFGIATCYSLQANFEEALLFYEKALLYHKSHIPNDPAGLEIILMNIELCKESQHLSAGDLGS